MAKKITPKHGRGKIAPWEKGESGNPNGRPRKLVIHVLEELKAKGITPVRPVDIVSIYEQLLNVTQDEIVEIVNDTELPYSIRLVAAAMTTKGRGFEIIERMIDRAHGRPKNEIELSGKLEPFLALMIESTGDLPDGEQKAVPASKKDKK